MANDNLSIQTPDGKAGRGDGLEIDLVELLYRLLEKARYRILAALLGALIAGGYTYLFVKPTYRATSRLYVLNTSSVINVSDLQMGSNLAKDYIEAFSTYGVYERAIRILAGDETVDDRSSSLEKYLEEQAQNGSPLTRADLACESASHYTQSQMRVRISVTNTSGTRILSVTCLSGDPVEAVRIADAYTLAARMFISDVMQGSNSNAQPPSVFELARDRGERGSLAGPNKTRNIILGFAVGLALAAMVIVVQFIVDDRVRNTEMLEKRLGLPVLGMMPATERDAESSGHHSGGSGHHSGHSGSGSRRKGGAK